MSRCPTIHPYLSPENCGPSTTRATRQFYRYITNKMVNDIRNQLRNHGFGSEDEEQYYKVVLAKTIMRQLALDVAFNTRKRDQ